MKETGIIMSGDHPQKCLDGTKTMTRRTWGLEFINKNPDIWEFMRVQADGTFLFWKKSKYASCKFEDPENIRLIKCPYGGVGDILVMKETWATENRYNHLKPSEIPDTAKIFYLASEAYDPFKMGIVRPSIFMPYKFSRGRLEISEVRAERLREITLEDIYDEGIDVVPSYDRIDAYKRLWDSLNAKRGYGWETNPWVWVKSFKRMDE